MIWSGQVCFLLLTALVAGAVSQDIGRCRMLREIGRKGSGSNRIGFKQVEDVDECEQICLAKLTCKSAEFRASSSFCFLFSSDTEKSPAGGVTFLTKACLNSDDITTLSTPSSTDENMTDPSTVYNMTTSIPNNENSTAGNDFSSNTTESTIDCSDDSTCEMGKDTSNVTVQPNVNDTSSENDTETTTSMSMSEENNTTSFPPEDMTSNISSSMQPVSQADMTTISNASDVTTQDTSNSSVNTTLTDETTSSLKSILSTSTVTAPTIPPSKTAESTALPAKTTQSTVASPAKTTQSTVASPAKTTQSTVASPAKTTQSTASPAKTTQSTPSPAKAGTTSKTGADVGITTAAPGTVPVTQNPNPYPYPYPHPYPGPQVSPGTPGAQGQYPPYRYPPYGYPPYGYPYPPYPPYPGYPPQYPYPQNPQVNPGPQIPIYQLPKGTDAPVKLHEKQNRLCFNRNKFPDLKLPQEKPKFFLIPSGDGKFSVVAVPTRYNPVVCFPVSYRGKVPILHLPAGNAPQQYNPYNRQPQFPFAGQGGNGQGLFPFQNGNRQFYPGATVPVPIDMEAFIKHYGGYLSETTPSVTTLPGGSTPTALPGKSGNESSLSGNDTNVNATLIGNGTDVTGIDGNDTISTPVMSINGTDILSNVTNMDNGTLPDVTGNGTNVTSTDGFGMIDNATDSNISSIILDALNKTSEALVNTTMETNLTYANATDVLLNETSVIEGNLTVPINKTIDTTTSAPTTESTTSKPHSVRGFGRPKPPWRASKRNNKGRPGRKPSQAGNRKKPVRPRKPLRPRKPVRPRRPSRYRPARDPKEKYKGKHPMRHVRRKWRKRNQKKTRYDVDKRRGQDGTQRHRYSLVRRPRRASFFF